MPETPEQALARRALEALREEDSAAGHQARVDAQTQTPEGRAQLRAELEERGVPRALAEISIQAGRLANGQVMDTISDAGLALHSGQGQLPLETPVNLTQPKRDDESPTGVNETIPGTSHELPRAGSGADRMEAIDAARTPLATEETELREDLNQEETPLEGEGVRFQPTPAPAPTPARIIPGDPMPDPADTSALDEVAEEARIDGGIAADEASMASEGLVGMHQRAADEMRKLREDYAQREQDAREAVDSATAQYQQAHDNLTARTTDPDRWWTNQNTSQRWMSGLAVALSAVGGLFRGDGTVPYLDTIRQQISDDLDQQEADIERADDTDRARLDSRGTLLQHFVQQLGDVRIAREAATQAAMAEYSQRLAAEAERIEDPVRREELMELSRRFAFQAAEIGVNNRQQLATIAAQQRRRARRVGGGGGSRGGGMGRARRDANGVVIGADGRPVERNLSHQQWLQDQARVVRNGLGGVNLVRELIASSGDDTLGTGRFAHMATAMFGEDVVNQFRSDESVGVRQMILKIIADLVKAQSGSQASEPEQERLRAVVMGDGSGASLQRGLEILAENFRAVAGTSYAASPEQAELAELGGWAQYAGGSPSLDIGTFVPFESRNSSGGASE